MLEVRDLCCRVGGFSLVCVNMEIPRGEYFVLLGPTGSGKTTLLRCIAGLQRLSGGGISLRGRDISRLNPAERNVGLLPQDYSLFPHLSVKENVLFGLKVRGLSGSGAEERLRRVSATLGIGCLLPRDTGSLSGGEKQRVTLARALVVHPDILLLDEPFSSVDPGTRERLWFEIKDILTAMRITVIHVTHNLDEASAVADRLGVIIGGRLEQVGPRESVFLRPASVHLARYLGIRNIFEGEIVESDDAVTKVRCSAFTLAALRQGDHRCGQRVELCVRPQGIKIIKEGVPLREDLRDNVFDGEILSSYFCNDYCTVKVRSVTDFEMRFPSYIYKRYNLRTGKRVLIGILRSEVTIFPQRRDIACN